MTTIDFRRLAEEAGFRDHHSADMWGVMLARDIQIERFAKLVAEAEREECAKQLDALGCDHCAAAIRARGKE
jgi:hypothetical protein